LKEWIKTHTPANTKATYGTYSRQYLAFTERTGMRPEGEVTLCAFMRDALESRKLARSTLVKVIPAAVEDLFRYEAESPARSQGGGTLLQRTKRTISMLTEKAKPKLPILRKHLNTMAIMCKDEPGEVRDMFMLLLMFVGFLRESEAVALLVTDVWIETVEETGQEALYVVVRKSKTDQYSENATIVIGACPGNNLCPVMWYRLHVSKQQGSPFLFHKLAKGKGEKLATTTPNHTVKRWLVKIGVSAQGYGSHSLRRGGATAAAKAKVQMHVIKRHGRWASDAVYLYIVDVLRSNWVSRRPFSARHNRSREESRFRERCSLVSISIPCNAADTQHFAALRGRRGDSSEREIEQSVL
jgi:integrase